MAQLLNGLINILLFVVPVPLFVWADQAKPDAAARRRAEG